MNRLLGLFRFYCGVVQCFTWALIVFATIVGGLTAFAHERHLQNLPSLGEAIALAGVFAVYCTCHVGQCLSAREYTYRRISMALVTLPLAIAGLTALEQCADCTGAVPQAAKDLHAVVVGMGIVGLLSFALSLLHRRRSTSAAAA